MLHCHNPTGPPRSVSYIPINMVSLLKAIMKFIISVMFANSTDYTAIAILSFNNSQFS